jgi:hypothetical protein
MDYIISLYSTKMDGMLIPIHSAKDKQDALERVADITGLQLVRCTEGDEDFIGFAEPNDEENKGKDLAAMMSDDMMTEGSPGWWWQAWIEEFKWDQNHPDAVSW